MKYREIRMTEMRNHNLFNDLLPCCSLLYLVAWCLIGIFTLDFRIFIPVTFPELSLVLVSFGREGRV